MLRQFFVVFTFAVFVLISSLASATDVVTISSPSNNATVSGSFTVSASFSPCSGAGLNHMNLIVDSTTYNEGAVCSFSKTLSLGTGGHKVTVQGVNSSGSVLASASITVNVGTSTQSSPSPSPSASATPSPSPVSSGTFCPQMTKGVDYFSGYSLFDAVVGRSTKSKRDIKFKASISGTASDIRYYNSSGSHALWNACTNAGYSLSACVTWCGDPKQRYSANGQYTKACPNGWQPFASTCATNYNACYSGGTGGVVNISVQSDDGTSNHLPSGQVLATATINQPNITLGFTSAFPRLHLSSGVTITAGKYYHLVVTNTDPNPSANWFSFDNYTPLSKFSASQTMLTGVYDLNRTSSQGPLTSPAVLSGTVGSQFSPTPDPNFFPMWAVQLTNGSCLGAGFLK